MSRSFWRVAKAPSLQVHSSLAGAGPAFMLSKIALACDPGLLLWVVALEGPLSPLRTGCASPVLTLLLARPAVHEGRHSTRDLARMVSLPVLEAYA